jgi:hypothetical protein
MALIKCKVCDKEVSGNAVSCPGCGEPIQLKKANKVATNMGYGALKVLRNIGYSALVLVLVVFLLLAVSIYDTEEEVAVKEIKSNRR